MNGPKSWLIVKSDVLAVEAKRVFGDEVNITTKGQRHWISRVQRGGGGKVLRWNGELDPLYEIALGQPSMHPTLAYKSKFTYFMPAIDSFENTLTLFGRPSTTYFSQHYSVKRNPPSNLRQLVI